jgi:hypothetical protein
MPERVTLPVARQGTFWPEEDSLFFHLRILQNSTWQNHIGTGVLYFQAQGHRALRSDTPTAIWFSVLPASVG